MSRPSMSTLDPPKGAGYFASAESPHRELGVGNVLISERVGHGPDVSVEPIDRGTAHFAVTVVEQDVRVGDDALSVSRGGETSRHSTSRAMTFRDRRRERCLGSVDESCRRLATDDSE